MYRYVLTPLRGKYKGGALADGFAKLRFLL